GHHRLGVAGGLDLRKVRQIADRWARLRIVGHVDGELAQERPLPVEYLDAPVAAVGHVDIALRVGSDRVRRVELARLGAFAAARPGVQILADVAHELAVGRELEQLRGRGGIGGAAGVARESTKMLPFEFTATPVTSPRYRFWGSLSGSDPWNGITGTASCENA